MLKKKSCLILGRGLSDQLLCNSSAITGDNTLFIDGVVKTLGRLPKDPPNEIHPYKKDFPLQNFEKYIIGTFPPISYILDNHLLNDAAIINLKQPIGAGGDAINLPWIPFYHGNQEKGSMWDFLLTIPEMAELTKTLKGDNANGRQNAKNYLIDFLLKNEINYADIIDSTQRNLNTEGRYDATDTNLNNICPNDNLICHILSNPEAKYLLFNTSSIFSNSGISFEDGELVKVDKNTKSFDLFVRQCQELGLEIQISIPNGNPAIWTNLSELTPPQCNTKLIFEMKIKNPLDNQKLNCDFKQGIERIFTIVTPFSPAARGRIEGNEIVKNWLCKNKNSGQKSSNLLTLVYQYFRKNEKNDLLPLLYEMNVYKIDKSLQATLG